MTRFLVQVGCLPRLEAKNHTPCQTVPKESLDMHIDAQALPAHLACLFRVKSEGPGQGVQPPVGWTRLPLFPLLAGPSIGGIVTPGPEYCLTLQEWSQRVLSCKQTQSQTPFGDFCLKVLSLHAPPLLPLR